MKLQSILRPVGFAAVLAATLGIVAGGCKDRSAPVEPSVSLNKGQANLGKNPTHGNWLNAVSGTGSGIVNVTATAEDQGTFHAQIEVNVYGASPNTRFLVQRKPDLTPNGDCTGTSFITFPGPAILTTSEDGEGDIHIDFVPPPGSPFLTTDQFDVRFRLLEDSPNPGATELQTDCFTVTVKK